SHSCTVCRATPCRRATSVTEAPSSSTSSTARYRCSTTPSSTSTPGPSRRDQPVIAAKRQEYGKPGNQFGVSPIYRNYCQAPTGTASANRSEEHTSELQSRSDLVCRLLL